MVLIIAAHSRKDASVPGNGVEIVNPRDTHVTTSIIGGSPGLRQAIHDSLAGIGHSTIKTVAVVQAAKTSFRHTLPHGVVLNFSYPKSPRAQVAYASWQAGLVAAATRDRAIARGLEPVVFYQARDVGVRLVEARIPSRSANSPTAAELIAHARRAARKLGVTSKHITILKPYGLAAAAYLDIRNMSVYISKHKAVFAPAVFPQRILSDSGATEIDGTYVELQYNGQPLAADYLDTRAHTSSRWIDRRYQGCHGEVRHGVTVLLPVRGVRFAPCPPIFKR